MNQQRAALKIAGLIENNDRLLLFYDRILTRAMTVADSLGLLQRFLLRTV
jgi:hypothetical protein